MTICEIRKALHRGQPADRLWAPAIEAAERGGRWRDEAGPAIPAKISRVGELCETHRDQSGN